jgi:hypothetical protein
MIRLLFVFSFLLCSITGFAQILPADGDTTNYRLCGFRVQGNTAAQTYVFEIAAGKWNDEKSFAKNIILTGRSEINRIIKTVPEWKKEYTWRARLLSEKDAEISKTPLYHFTTGYISYIDTAKYRLKILGNTGKHLELLIFFDNTRTLYDANGSPLWFLPHMPDVTSEFTSVRDIRPTPQGTIVFTTTVNAFEVDYNGNVLWVAPNNGKISKDTSEFYHHEFFRRPNGNYIIAGSEMIRREIKDLKLVDTANFKDEWRMEKVGNKVFKKIQSGTIIEYDGAKNITWYWKASDYFTDADFFSRRTSSGVLNTSTHMNSFDFDEKNSNIYVGFRDVSRIVKISYPSGKMLASYGDNYVPGEKRTGAGLFHAQHNCRVSAEGYLYLFNNNTPLKGIERPGGIPPVSSIVFLKEPVGNSDTITRVWEFKCNIDSFSNDFGVTGGGVAELSDGSILCTMGTNNRSFIVGRDKKLHWNALMEMYNGNNMWVPAITYRINPLETMEELDKLIFNTK